MKSDQVLVIDFGSQYNQLICRRIRELGVYSELKSHKITAQDIKQLTNVKGIILSGSPNTVTDKDSFVMDPDILNLGIPIMGICYGMQLITHMNGGVVERSSEREYGKTEIKTDGSGIFENIPIEQIVWMSHGYHVKTLPLGFIANASSESCPILAVHLMKIRIYIWFNFTQKLNILFMELKY